MSNVRHQPAADNYIALLRAFRLQEEVALIVQVAEELVTPGGELTVVHLEDTVHALMLQGKITLRTDATAVD